MQRQDIPVEGFERVVEFKNSEIGFHAIIAIHDTRLGPALGGIRAFPYATVEQALTDATRLSKGMSYKAAVSETGTGGGKAVLILQEGQKKTEALLLALAEAVNCLEGKYICAEDYGITQADLDVIALKTRYIVGFARTSGDPSRFTGWGGLRGLQAVASQLWGSASLEGKRVAIQGLGAVGMRLAMHLFWEGADLIVSDIDPQKVKQAQRDFNAKAVGVNEILSTPCDILSPCALGAIINDDSIDQLQCQAIAGLANNQLLRPEHGDQLFKKGILYAPDFVINAGGLINVCQEIRSEGYDASEARRKVDLLNPILQKIFKLSEQKQIATSRIATEIAEYHLDAGIGRRQLEPVFHQ